jgi:3-methyl-2-oxobutanoate hydroxymethyltransferase
MTVLARSVARGARRPLVLVDLPFASFESSDARAVDTALHFVQAARVDGIKLEPARVGLSRARAICEAGVPVMAHLGLSSQDVMDGVFDPLGNTAAAARQLVDSALAYQEAGVFAVLLEALPAELAGIVTEKLVVPTIGVGSGAGCSGQILSLHDVVGLDPRHDPPWVRHYGALYDAGLEAVQSYVAEVRDGRFPAGEHSFAMAPEALESVKAALGTG